MKNNQSGKWIVIIVDTALSEDKMHNHERPFDKLALVAFVWKHVHKLYMLICKCVDCKITLSCEYLIC